MRLPGDVACFVELTNVSVVPDEVTGEDLAYIRGADGTVACAAAPTPGAAWMVSISGGVRSQRLRVGDSVLVSGVHRLTGDPFAVPARLFCTAVGDIARFALPAPRGAALARSGYAPRW